MSTSESVSRRLPAFPHARFFYLRIRCSRQPPARPSKVATRVHPDRAARRDRDHRGVDRTAAAGGAGIVTIPSDVVFVGTLPTGTARNNGTLIMPNPILVANFPAWVQNCSAALAADRTNHTSALGEAWIFDITGVSFGNLLLPPNPPTPNCDSSTVANNTLQNPGMFGLASNHPGGANVVMRDGSVKFLKNSIDEPTLWEPGSIAQGEIISADSY